VVSAVRVTKDVISVVKSRFCVVSRVVVRSPSVTKDVSTDVSADVSEMAVSKVVVSSAVIEDVSVSIDVWNEVSAVVSVVSIPERTVELGLGRHAPALTAWTEARAIKPASSLDETIVTNVMMCKKSDKFASTRNPNKQVNNKDSLDNEMLCCWASRYINKLVIAQTSLP
jgi:hypothetical protein